MKKKFIWSILTFLGVGLLLFYFLQDRFLFLPGKRLSTSFQFQFPQQFQEINLTTQDNQTINALHFQLENPKGVILFFHGNKGNLNRWGTIVPYLLDYEYEVFVMDYRGYGKSTGKVNEEAMYNDALATYDYLNKQFDEDKIVVYGRSLGATFASKVGAERAPKHIVLEAPFYTMKHAAKKFFALAPTFVMNYTFDNEQLATKMKSPMTIFHGDEDRTTSFEESKLLFEKVASKQKQFVAIEGGTHHNLKDFELYKKKLASILGDKN